MRVELITTNISVIKLVILMVFSSIFPGCDSVEKQSADKDKTDVATCKVNDVDIATSYSGDCKDGLAHGRGIAKGRDVYQGEFDKGDVHGYGIYTWGDNSDWSTQKYEGWSYKGERTGYGATSAEVGSKKESY